MIKLSVTYVEQAERHRIFSSKRLSGAVVGRHFLKNNETKNILKSGWVLVWWVSFQLHTSSFMMPSSVFLRNPQSQTPVHQSGGHTKWCGSLETWHPSDDNTLLKITSWLSACSWHLENATRYYQPHLNGANQASDKSIYKPDHTDFLPSAIINMVYLLTWATPKSRSKQGAELLWDSCSCPCAAAVKSLTSLTLLFIWKSLVLLNLIPLLTQNQISDLIISQDSIVEAKPFLFFGRPAYWHTACLKRGALIPGWQCALKILALPKRSQCESPQQPSVL